MKIHSEDFIWGGIFVFIILGLIGCAIWIRVNNNSIKVIDGCQYIHHYNGHGWDLVHKGNCTNLIHYKK
jgi:hypothetical protein